MSWSFELAKPMEHGFVLVGADLPVRFLKNLGIKLENEWEGSALIPAVMTLLTFVGLWFLGSALGGPAPLGIQIGPAGPVVGVMLAAAALSGLFYLGAKGNRWAWLGISFFVWYSIYGIKYGNGSEFWPYRGWGYTSLSLFERP